MKLAFPKGPCGVLEMCAGPSPMYVGLPASTSRSRGDPSDIESEPEMRAPDVCSVLRTAPPIDRVSVVPSGVSGCITRCVAIGVAAWEPSCLEALLSSTWRDIMTDKAEG